jgi:hemoglobin/transferrin/lactoferrin receptor protein
MLLPLILAVAPQGVSTADTYVFSPRDAAPATTPIAGRTLISGTELRETGARSLPQAIAQAGGIWMQETNLGGGSAFIRGLTGNQIVIVVDGVRLNDATTRFGPNQVLNTIDPYIVDSVEILRGPASVLYGSDAIGGVILINTRRETPTANGGVRYAIDVNANSSVEGLSGSPAAGLRDATQGLLFVGSLFDYGDINTGSGMEAPTGYDGFGGFLNWNGNFGDDENLAVTVWEHRDNDVPRTDRLVTGFGQTNPSDDVYLFEKQDRKRAQLTYTNDDFDWDMADAMQIRLYAQTYDEDRQRMSFGSSTTRFESDETQTLGLGIDWTKKLSSDHLLTYGFDVSYDEVDSTRTDVSGGTPTVKDGQFAPNSQYTSFGAFVQDEIFSFDPIDITAGLRFSAVDFEFDNFGGAGSESGDFTAITASLQAARDLTDHQRLTATLAQGFRAPNLDDLAKDGDFGGGTELHNADLDPERSLTAELAWDYTRDRLLLGAAIFGTEIRDLVGRQLQDEGTPAPGDETYIRENLGKVRLYGVELGGEWQLAEDSPFTTDFSIAYVRGRLYDDTFNVVAGEAVNDGVEYRRIPPLNGRVGLTWRPDTALAYAPGGVGFEKARVGLTWAASQDQLNPDDISDPRINPDGTPGWARVDLDFTGPLGSGEAGGLGGRSRWTFGVHNLFDAGYRVHGSGFDAAGMSLAVGLHWAP